MTIFVTVFHCNYTFFFLKCMLIVYSLYVCTLFSIISLDVQIMYQHIQTMYSSHDWITARPNYWIITQGLTRLVAELFKAGSVAVFLTFTPG